MPPVKKRAYLLSDAEKWALATIRFTRPTPTRLKKVMSLDAAQEMLDSNTTRLRGFVTDADDVADCVTTADFKRRLALPGRNFSEWGWDDDAVHVIVETDTTGELAAGLAAPIDSQYLPAGFPVHPDRWIENAGDPPFTGNGFAGSFDNHLTYEARMREVNGALPQLAPPSANGQARAFARFRNADGSPAWQRDSLGNVIGPKYTQNGVTYGPATDWKVVVDQASPSGLRWVPLP